VLTGPALLIRYSVQSSMPVLLISHSLVFMTTHVWLTLKLVPNTLPVLYLILLCVYLDNV
jgi:hypothetical protein